MRTTRYFAFLLPAVWRPATRAPGARLARFACGVATLLGLGPQPKVKSARATSDAFDSPQARGLSDVCEKPALALALPPDVGAEVGPQGGRLCRPDCGCHFVQPDPTPAAEGLRKQGRTNGGLCFSSPSAASRPTDYRCTQRYWAMAALGRAAQRPTAGGRTLCAARTFGRRGSVQSLQTVDRGYYRGGPIGRVRYAVSRRVRLGARKSSRTFLCLLLGSKALTLRSKRRKAGRDTACRRASRAHVSPASERPDAFWLRSG